MSAIQKLREDTAALVKRTYDIVLNVLGEHIDAIEELQARVNELEQRLAALETDRPAQDQGAGQ